MFNDNKLSSTVQRAAFSDTVARRTVPLVDYERGGRVSEGGGDMNLLLWKLEWVDGSFVISAEGQEDVTVFQSPGVLSCSLAFDFTMRPYIAYVDASGGHFRYFDTQTSAFVIMDLGSGVLDPRCTLDERASQHADISDVILSYTRGNSLYFRMQRDRFQTEYLLTSNAGGKVTALYRNQIGRLQWRIKPN